MDDLSGLDFNNSTKPNSSSSTARPGFSYPSLQPTPSPSISGRSTPLSLQQSGGVSAGSRAAKPPSKPATPANDSFSGLLSIGANKSGNNLSLQERQKQLLEEKARQAEEQRKKQESQYGTHNAQFWDTLGGSKPTTPSPALSLTPIGQTTLGSGLSNAINKPFASINGRPQGTPAKEEAEEDILAAFNSEAPVDASSHFPVPVAANSGRSTPHVNVASRQPAGPSAGSSSNGGFLADDDDDPFGLSQFSQKKATHVSTATTAAANTDDDDILGMLGKPVSELPPPKPQRREPKPHRQKESSDDETTAPTDPRDKAVAELVDMGFPADKSAIALAQTPSRKDIQAAVGWLLNQAHEEAKQKSKGSHGGTPSSAAPERAPRESSRRRPDEDGDGDVPGWMRRQGARPDSTSRNQEGRSPAREKDVTAYAQDIGSSLFKSANSLWKTGQKKVQKAVSEFNQDGDPSQPKWMRDAQLQEAAERKPKEPGLPSRPGKQPDRGAQASVTDEAMILEAGVGRPQKPPRPSPAQRQIDPQEPRSRNQTPPGQQRSQQPSSMRLNRPNRFEVEEQSAQAYISPARRKKTTPTPSEPSSEPASRQSTLSPNNPFRQQQPAQQARSKLSTPVPPSSRASSAPPPRPKAPPRQIPQLSPSALSTSSTHRQKGTEAFKRGDYGAAHQAYTAALAPLPGTHPIAIVVYCNRALTSLKNGEPKAAIADADSALEVIGVSRGDGERIALGGGEAEKDMKEFFGKALMRKAEALESLEKWADAAKAWRDAVEAGHGGSVSIQGRNRCEKAAGISTPASSKPATPPPAASRPPPPKPKPKASALDDLSGTSRPAIAHAASAEAVQKLRAANLAAERADDEKFALADSVDAKLVAWKGTKADNLRALLGSLDKVLWPEANWTKVGMNELIMANRVKIVYMKAIAKVHPDKIPQSATTEQKMISASVFATLNEAWDKFKTDNGL